MSEQNMPPLRQIAVIGNYMPRQCGIATFTTDLCEGLAAEYPGTNVMAVPVNDKPEGYDYPERVRFELFDNDAVSYRQAADFLNLHNVDLVCVQHEYGIFGGPSGSHVLTLLRELRMPVVATLHTVLREPDPEQRRVLMEVAAIADRLVVMSRRGADFLQDIYNIPAEKIALIPHGIPDMPFVDPNFYKDQFGVAGKTVLLTFGLLSANKGIEHVIEALPAIRERYPNVVYVVLGTTHPHVKRHEGERYREMLHALARERGVADHVIFFDQFVSLQELTEFIGAADIYITPYLNPAQIVSGTLAYAAGAGKAVISTPYWYAEELLAEGRGRLTPFRDAAAIAEQVVSLLDNEAERHALRKRSYTLGREMIWSEVAHRYMETFEAVRRERQQKPRALIGRGAREKRTYDLPPLRLDHLRRLTDDTGMVQHAIFAVPNYAEGYTTDDNARALIAATLLEELATEPGVVEPMAARYMAFLCHAFNPEVNRFRNFMAFDRRWLEECGSDDSQGRAIWSLGRVLGRSRNPGLLGPANRLFAPALPAITASEHLRTWAFALLGLHEYLRRFNGDRAARLLRDQLAERLLERYQTEATADWPWFEPTLTYDNARLPQALLLSGQAMDRSDMVETALAALRWLLRIQQAPDGHFVPIGCEGFYPRGGVPARFDQQPLEANALASACLDAWRISDEAHWHAAARLVFDWFLGRNDLGLPLYDPATGGCRDGLHADRVNQNQGAESTLAFLLALLELRQADQVIDAAALPAPAKRARVARSPRDSVPG